MPADLPDVFAVVRFAPNLPADLPDLAADVSAVVDQHVDNADAAVDGMDLQFDSDEEVDLICDLADLDEASDGFFGSADVEWLLAEALDALQSDEQYLETMSTNQEVSCSEAPSQTAFSRRPQIIEVGEDEIPASHRQSRVDAILDSDPEDDADDQDCPWYQDSVGDLGEVCPTSTTQPRRVILREVGDLGEVCPTSTTQPRRVILRARRRRSDTRRRDSPDSPAADQDALGATPPRKVHLTARSRSALVSSAIPPASETAREPNTDWQSSKLGAQLQAPGGKATRDTNVALRLFRRQVSSLHPPPGRHLPRPAPPSSVIERMHPPSEPGATSKSWGSENRAAQSRSKADIIIELLSSDDDEPPKPARLLKRQKSVKKTVLRYDGPKTALQLRLDALDAQKSAAKKPAHRPATTPVIVRRLVLARLGLSLTAAQREEEKEFWEEANFFGKLRRDHDRAHRAAGEPSPAVEPQQQKSQAQQRTADRKKSDPAAPAKDATQDAMGQTLECSEAPRRSACTDAVAWGTVPAEVAKMLDELALEDGGGNPADYWVDGAWDMDGLRSDIILQRQQQPQTEASPVGHADHDSPAAVVELTPKRRKLKH